MRFLFYDSVLEMEPGKRALASKAISIGDEFLPDHYSRCPIMPTSLVLECLAQVAGWLYIVTEDFSVSTIPALFQGIEVHGVARPGNTLLLEVWFEYGHRGGASFRGEARTNLGLVLRAERLTFACQREADERYKHWARQMFGYLSGNYQLDRGSPSD
jgi:3-hydroxyacyl-[acyl-carrier-protein] dehydratase